VARLLHELVAHAMKTTHLKYLIPLLGLLACSAPKLLPEVQQKDMLVLPPAANLPEVRTVPHGLEEYLVLREEKVNLYQREPNFVQLRGQEMGAQVVLQLQVDQNSQFRTINKYCWGCLLLDVALVSATAVVTKSVPSMPNIDYGYQEEVQVTNYFYHLVYLIHPDSIRLPDKVRMVEFYDADDKLLLGTAHFDWNEQLQKIDGSTTVPLAWLNLQPIGFMHQIGSDWENEYNENKEELKRYNVALGYQYKIRATGLDEYRVHVDAPTKDITLLTLYYGQHDWTISCDDKENPLRFDYYLDNIGRMHHMTVTDAWSGKIKKYNVRIYYREATDTFPEEWRWRSYRPDNL